MCKTCCARLVPAPQVRVGWGLLNPNPYPYPYAPAVLTRTGLQTHDIPYEEVEVVPRGPSILYLDMWLSETKPPYEDAASIPVVLCIFLWKLKCFLRELHDMCQSQAKDDFWFHLSFNYASLSLWWSQGVYHYCTFHSIQQSPDFFALPKNLKKADKSKKINSGVKKNGCYVLLLNWLK